MKLNEQFTGLIRAISFLVFTSLVLINPNASYADSFSCRDLLSAAESRVEDSGFIRRHLTKINKIRNNLPKVFLDPIPRYVKSIDNGKVDELVESFKDLIDQQKEAELIPLLVSNEAKIAYLEAMELYVREKRKALSSPSVINFLRKKKTRDLLKYVSKWLDGERLGADTFSKVMDLVYLNGNSVLPKDKVLESGAAVLRLARLRWEAQLLKFDFGNVILDEHSKLFKANKAFYWMSALGFNYLSIAKAGFPSFYPSFSLTNSPLVRKNIDNFFSDENIHIENFDAFYAEFKGILKFDYYNSWIQRVAPWVLSPAIIYFATVSTFQDQVQAYVDSPAYQQSISIMTKEYEFLYGKKPDEEVMHKFHKRIFGYASIFLKEK